VPGKVMAADVVKLTSAKTVNGQSVKIAVKDGKVTGRRCERRQDRHRGEQRRHPRDRPVILPK